jgi:hypothetical protein
MSGRNGTVQAKATREAKGALAAAGLSAGVRKITSCLNGPDGTFGTCTLVDIQGDAGGAAIRSALAALPRAEKVFGTGLCIIVSRGPEA